MSIANSKEMLLSATIGGYAVGAFNVTNLIQMKAAVEAAISKKAPLIIQASVTPSKFFGPGVLVAAFRGLAESAPIPICLHLDHSTDVEFSKVCAEAGFNNVMIDASKHDLKENIRQTKFVCDYCHAKGITVEGELGTLTGIEDQVLVLEEEASLCDPEQALKFVDETGVDSLAPAIGTAHGIYKTQNPKLDLARLKKIAKLINGSDPRVPLVIHGGTGLKPDLVKKLIACGGAKYNVSTDLKHTLVDTTYNHISCYREEYDPGLIDAAVKEAIKSRIEYWIDLLGSSGRI